MLCLQCLLNPSAFVPVASSLVMAKAVGLPLSIIAIAVICLYLTVQRHLSVNNLPAVLIGYPDEKDIAKLLADTTTTTEPLFQPPLRTVGRYIVDKNGTRFKLASVNWYGASDKHMIPGGLDIQHREDIALTIRKLGFNSVRLPYADEMVLKNPVVPSHLLAANADLDGFRALDVFHAVVESLTNAGIAVIVNNHITTARWCCDGNPCDAQWSNEFFFPLCPVRQSEVQWIQNWERVMRPLIDNPYVVGADLRNEVRSPLGRRLWSSWARAAEECGERLHQLQPEWLMIVEGVQSANDVSGARKRPVKLSTPHKLVYSAHVYGWSGWGQLSPYWKREYDSFAQDMQKNWAWLLDENIAPVWIGEIGAPMKPGEGDLHYWQNLMRFLEDCDADFGYWAINPRKPDHNAFETYSLVHDDWETPRLDYRISDMARLAQGKAMFEKDTVRDEPLSPPGPEMNPKEAV